MTVSLPPIRCPECNAEIAAGLLACPGCARLVYADDLSQLALRAQEAERAGDWTTALAAWRRATELLPAATAQRAAIEKRMRTLSATVDGRSAPVDGRGAPMAGEAPTGARGAKARAAARVGIVGVVLLKSKALLGLLAANAKLLLLGLTKIPTLLSMLIYIPWMSGRGVGFALGLVASIYVHEVGHIAALRRYGIEASAPMFVPGFGAFVRMRQYPTDAHEEARTGLAGPLWGLVAALVAFAFGKLTASQLAINVASVGATINCFNLIPVWQLDGARGLHAMSRGERGALAVAAVLTAALTHQWMPLVVGLTCAVRAFSSDAHPTGDRRVAILFAALVVGHGLLGMIPTAYR